MSGYPMRVVELLAGEHQQHDRFLGGAAAEYSVASADKLVKTGPGIFYGLLITTALGANPLSIRDSTSAGAGNILMTVPASAAVGNVYVLPVGIIFNTGLFLDFAGTGTVVALYI